MLAFAGAAEERPALTVARSITLGLKVNYSRKSAAAQLDDGF
jgi:hypothetical protein